MPDIMWGPNMTAKSTYMINQCRLIHEVDLQKFCFSSDKKDDGPVRGYCLHLSLFLTVCIIRNQQKLLHKYVNKLTNVKGQMVSSLILFY